MTATVVARPWLSGFCNASNPQESHLRCPGGQDANPTRTWRECSCACHAAPPAPTQAFEVVDGATYRSPEWYAARRTSVSASEVAAIVGLSPWQSAFDLWWLKASGDDSQPENDSMSRGRRAEPLILEDFAEAHPELRVEPGELVRSIERPWQVATPDAIAYETTPTATLLTEPSTPEWNAELDRIAHEQSLPVAVVEAKTAEHPAEWGEPGTDEIPVHYRCQVLWQMDVLGVDVAHVPMWTGFSYREYLVTYDPTDVALLRQAARDFLDSVEHGARPDPDAHRATTRRLKRLHPDLVDDAVEVPIAWVKGYQAAQRIKKRAEDRMRLYENRVRHALGPAATAEYVDGDGNRRTFTHTISDQPERTQTVRAHRRDSVNFPRKAVS